MDAEPTQTPAPGRFRLDVFRISLPLCVIVGLWGIVAPDQLARAAGSITRITYSSVDWFFLLSVTGFVVLMLYLGYGRFGKLRLGAEGDEPEFSTPSWIAMLFAAGMGVGLLFWGAAEPVLHYMNAPGVPGQTKAAAQNAMVITAFHWGLHAWACYGLGALVLAYFGFRKRFPYLPGAPIRGVFKGRWVRPTAFSADLIAVLAVAFGVAGSLAMGIFQLQAGLHVVTGISNDSIWVAVGILIALVAAYMTSATTGLDKGIKWLSNINMVLAIILMLAVLLASETSHLMRVFVSSAGDYVSRMVSMTLQTYPQHADSDWLQKWTLTYFIWWIAWAPFVGVFIARISRGRTLREFVTGVLIVPTLFSLLWFAIFGGTALHEEMHGAGGIGELVNQDVTVALFTLFERLPGSSLLSVIAMLLDFIFLVTSADSATYVLGMLTSDGAYDPPVRRKVGWGVTIGAMGAALMLSKNIHAVRSMTVLGALPFTLVMLLQAAALGRALMRERP
jgi:glycine betaine transporter